MLCYLYTFTRFKFHPFSALKYDIKMSETRHSPVISTPSDNKERHTDDACIAGVVGDECNCSHMYYVIGMLRIELGV